MNLPTYKAACARIEEKHFPIETLSLVGVIKLRM